MSIFVRTFKVRKLFLDQLEVGSSISFAAEAAGGTTQQFRKWRKDDPNFAADWDEAIEVGTDFLEDVATRRAMAKSDPLMIMMLKARRPDKYDRGSKLELSGNINVEGSKQKLLNKIARLQAASRPVLEKATEEEQEVPEESTPLLPPPTPSTDQPIVRGRKRNRTTEGSGRASA